MRSLVILALLLLAPAARAQSKGDRVEVLWKGQWYNATVVAAGAHERKWKIKYDGWGDAYNEWVTPSRLRQPSVALGEAVQVIWRGSWYPAILLEARPGEYRVHYDGYPSSEDEWVAAERVKAR